MKQYEAESRFSLCGDSLTGLLIHLGRHKRENVLRIRTRCQEWASQEEEGEHWRDLDFTDLINYRSTMAGVWWQSHFPTKSRCLDRCSYSHCKCFCFLFVWGFFVLFCLCFSFTLSPLPPNFWQSLVSDTWQEALLFETALLGQPAFPPFLYVKV